MSDAPSDSASSAARRIRIAGEVVLLSLAVAPVWAFASVEPVWEFVVAALVAVLVALWAAHAAVAREFRFRPDVVSVALAGLVVWSAAQLVPLPLGVVRAVSPGAAAAHEGFRPAVSETLPGEPPGAPRPDSLTLSVEPAATRTFAIRLTAVLLVYAAARNWLASAAAFRRLAWAATGNGLALAVLALGQFFSSPRDTAFWSVDVGGSVFGPFVNRNHYSDFLAGCLGLGVGLTLTLRSDRAGAYTSQPQKAEDMLFLDKFLSPFKYLDQPWPLAAAGAVAVMAVSVLFSLSRGGVLALAVAAVGCALVARWKREAGSPGVGKWALAAAVVLAVGMASWFGWEPVRARFATLVGPREEADDRTGLWKESVRAGAGFWLTGSGHGTFARVETLGRRDGPSALSNNHAHNEYLEAAVEGGVVRLALTLLLVGGALVTVGRGFLTRRGGPDNSLLLGAWFGLAALAVHAVTDFGLHLPAVAVFAAVLAGYAVAASTDARPRVRKKVRVRVRKSVAIEPPAPPAVTTPSLPPPRAPDGPRDTPGVAVAVLAAGIAVAVAWDAWTRTKADRLLGGAEAFRRSDAPNRDAGRIEYLTARANLRPADATAWFDLAQAHIDRGTPDDIRAALAALRAARDRCPLYPEAQFRLGLFARSFQTGDPPLAYLDRARQLLVVDADVWYATGMEALRSGDEATAWTNFRHALGISDQRFKAIVAEAGKRLTPAQLGEKVLPDDPLMLMRAADQLYPDIEKQADSRRPLLERAAAAKAGPSKKPEPLIAVARALGELGRTADAEAAWRKAVEFDPDPIRTRDLFAKWLEAEELYAMAIPELEWLTDKSPVDQGFRLRLMTARHVAALQAQIGK